ncbi:hypothetical protein F3Y22_tig00110271pilonHSYRG00109 [Hibiscus syriacus]|uniref:MULE transposase domain-containing protein n=1 Tax=Hibiscus syriacus TaxID=106335 RepID=A0A6A3B4Z8_HIBSY|nr:hypothetical protein F3Y22_tig00110271pilonHSYRG00109 [Hibiscus syriacus]
MHISSVGTAFCRDTAIWEGSVQDVATERDGGIDAGGGGGGEAVQETENTNEDDEESDSEEQNAYSINVPYLSDDKDDNELQSDKKKIKGKKYVDEENDSGLIGNDTEIHDEAVDEGGNNGVTKGVGRNDTDYYDSDDYGSLIRSDDDQHEECARRRGRYPIYNPNIESPHFSLGMLFIDGKQFKDVKTFIDEHNCPVSFSNGMMTAKGPFKDILLSVVGRDGNDQMYPITWAVVEGESIDSWSWFISIVAADLGLVDGFVYTIITDQHKSGTSAPKKRRGAEEPMGTQESIAPKKKKLII